MSAIRTVLWASFLISSTGLCRADISQLQALLQSLPRALENNRPGQDPPESRLLDSAVRAATVDDLQAFSRSVRNNLHSPEIYTRAAGLMVVLSIGFRLADGSKLLEPYVDDLGLLLDDPDQGIRNGAIYILGSHPASSPKALAYIEAHLNDKANDDGAARAMAGALLQSGDRSAVSKALALVQQRPALQGEVIQMLGRLKITTEDALNFVHAGLKDPKLGIRRTSVDAVGNLPKEVRKGFEPDLLHLMADPDEDPQVSERARQVLIHERLAGTSMIGKSQGETEVSRGQ